MAKDKKNKKAKEVKTETKEAAPEFKYGVPDIAEALGIEPTSVRVKLRNAGIEKAGKSYGWNSKSELKEVIDELKAGSSKDEDDEDEKPKKKGKGKKADKAPKSEKKSKGKKAKKAKDEDEDDDDEDDDDD